LICKFLVITSWYQNILSCMCCYRCRQLLDDVLLLLLLLLLLPLLLYYNNELNLSCCNAWIRVRGILGYLPDTITKPLFCIFNYRFYAGTRQELNNTFLHTLYASIKCKTFYMSYHYILEMNLKPLLKMF
jgi:hypothetical protein